jgi:hypothetical protein
LYQDCQLMCGVGCKFFFSEKSTLLIELNEHAIVNPQKAYLVTGAAFSMSDYSVSACMTERARDGLA